MKSNLKQAERNRGNNRFLNDPPQQQQQQQQKPKFSTDGRKPRVKSNLKQAERDRGNNRFSKNEFRRKILRNRQRFDTVDFEENPKNDNNRLGKTVSTTTVRSPVNFQNTEEPEITTNRPNFNFADLFSSDLVVKPDGRTPRVKSNIKQKKANNGRPFAKSHKIPVPSDLFEPKFHEERSISDPISSQNLLTASSRNVSQSVSQKNKLLQLVDNEILPPSKAEKKQNNQNNLLAELGMFSQKMSIMAIFGHTSVLSKNFIFLMKKL